MQHTNDGTAADAQGSRLRRIALWAGAATLVFHLAANPHYGFFRDELYFIVCGQHPAFGYVDQPPLVPLAAALSQVFGTSLFLLRTVAAIAAAVAVYVCGLLAIEFGGGVFAIVLTAICVAFAPVLAAFGAKVGTDTFMLWTWPLATLFIVRATRQANAVRWWIAAGATIGVAAESKYSVLFFVVAVLAGLAAGVYRNAFASRGFWLGVATAAVIALPNFLWQAAHGFAMVELLRNGSHGKNVVLSPPSFVIHQFVLTGALLALVWIAGLVWLAMRRDVRWLSIAYAVLLVTMIVLHAKDYYPAAIYGALFAAGGVAVETWTARLRWTRAAVGAVAVACGVALLPMVEPILPVQAFVAYTHAIGVKPAPSEHQRPGVLPQDYADMHGWRQLAATVARVYDGLPEPRSDIAVFASNYGEAAAIDVFGRPLGLPHAISGHNAYYVWGPGSGDPRTIVDVNGDLATDRKFCASASVAARVDAPYAMPYEQGIPVIVCRGLREPLTKLWPKVKVYI
jgi:hypothetical protein